MYSYVDVSKCGYEKAHFSNNNRGKKSQKSNNGIIK